MSLFGILIRRARLFKTQIWENIYYQNCFTENVITNDYSYRII